MQRLIIIILAVIVTLPVILKSRVSEIISAPTAFSVISSSKVVVRVSGDVRHAGIYKAGANTLAMDVINMAEPVGPAKFSETDKTVTRTVVNGSDIRLKVMPDGTGVIAVGAISSAERIVLGIPLDINAMSEADFDRLPGIGPVMAAKIIRYRQNNGGKMRVEDLLAIEGIGEMKYQKLNKYF